MFAKWNFKLLYEIDYIVPFEVFQIQQNNLNSFGEETKH